MRLNVQKKIIIIIIIILFLALGSSTLASLFKFQKGYKEILQTKVAVVGKNLQHTLDESLMLGFKLDELPQINAECQTIVSLYKEIQYCYVADSETKVLYHSDLFYINKYIKYSADKKTVLTKDAFIRFSSFENNKFYEIFLPVLKDDRQVGEIRLGLPVYIIDAGMNSIIINSILIAWCSFCFAILCSLFLARNITKPIRELRLGTEIIGKGNLDYKVKIKSDDEIGQLADAFNKMTMELKRRTGELTRSKVKSETILNSIGDAVCAINKNKKIILFNSAAEKITGWKIKEALGSTCYKILRPTDKKGEINYCDIRCPLNKTSPINKNISCTTKEGVKVPISSNVAPIKDANGKCIGSIIVFRDITQEQIVDKMKTEFISIASHQLRTPLAAINWLVEMLKEESAGKITKTQGEYLNDIYYFVKRMIRLSDNLLNVSKLEAGVLQINSKPVQLEEIISRIIRQRKTLTTKKQCRIIFKKPSKKLPAVFLDEPLISQVIDNLLINAVYYSGSDQCRITIELKKRARDYLIAVSDEGIGIPKDKQEHIFEKFFRIQEVRKVAAEGTGLGLYISKMIMEASGGKIWFKSKEKKGTSFYVSIPLKGMRTKE